MLVVNEVQKFQKGSGRRLNRRWRPNVNLAQWREIANMSFKKKGFFYLKEERAFDLNEASRTLPLRSVPFGFDAF